jgi:hypothetical protein
VSDVRRGSSRAPGSGQDVRVTGPDIDLNFPDTHVGCGTGPQSCDVAMDRRPTEEQAPAGELAGFTALGTHEVSVRVAARPCSESGPAGTLARLAMSATAVSKRVQTDHAIAYPVYTR